MNKPLNMEIKKIDRYEILRLLGRGGQGTVYLVRDPLTEHQIALKLLTPMMNDRGAAIRFHREFQAISRLSHPGVMTVYEQGLHHDQPFYTMEYIQGCDLKAYRDTHPGWDHICYRMSLAADALAYVHRNNFIHRDLKPGNILMTPDGQPKLMDFGLVKPVNATTVLTMSQNLMGTLHYISPEQFRCDEIDFRSDLYSFGVILYELLTGKLPFECDSIFGMITLQMSSTPVPISAIVRTCPSELSRLCEELLAKEPWDRPASADIVADRLRTIADILKSKEQIAIQSPPDMSGPPLRPRFVNRHNEMDYLASTLSANRDHPLTFTLVSGESGIGKSRLLREASIQCLSDQQSIVRVRKVGAGSEILDDWDELIQQIVDQIEKSIQHLHPLTDFLPELAPLHPAFNIFRTARQAHHSQDFLAVHSDKHNRLRYLTRIFARLTQITHWLIIIEDLNQSNSFYINFFQDLFKWSDIEPIHCAIWTTVRQENFSSRGDMDLFTNQFSYFPGYRHLELGRLSDSDSRELVSSMVNQPFDSNTVSTAVRLCDGHPMMLVETIRGWAAQGDLVVQNGAWILVVTMQTTETIVPYPLQKILQNQIRQLPVDQLETLTWIAVLQLDAFFEVIKFLDSGSEPEMIERLNDLIFHRFLTAESTPLGERYRICHLQIQELLLQTLSATSLKRYHRNIIEILQNLGEPFSEPARIARYQEAVGDMTGAIRNWYQAGQNAIDQELYIKARNCLLHAYQLIPRLNDQQKKMFRMVIAKIVFFLIRSKSYLGDLSNRSGLFDELFALVSRDHDKAFYQDVLYQYVIHLVFTGQIEKGWQKIEELKQFRESDEIPRSVLYLEGYIQFIQDNTTESLHLFRQVMKGIVQDGMTNSHYFCQVLWMIGKCHQNARKWGAAERLYQFILKKLKENQRLSLRGAIYSSLGHVHLFRREYEIGREFLHRALEIHKQTGDEYFTICDQYDIGMAFSLERKLNEALEYVVQAFDEDVKRGQPREILICSMTLTDIYLKLGLFHQAVIACAKALESARSTPLFETYLQIELYHVYLKSIFDDHEQIVEELVRIHREWNIRPGRNIRWNWWLSSAIMTAYHQKRFKRALTLLDHLNDSHIQINSYFSLPAEYLRLLIRIRQQLPMPDEMLSGLYQQLDGWEIPEDEKWLLNTLKFPLTEHNQDDGSFWHRYQETALTLAEPASQLRTLEVGACFARLIDRLETATELDDARCSLKCRLSKDWPEDVRSSFLDRY